VPAISYQVWERPTDSTPSAGKYRQNDVLETGPTECGPTEMAQCSGAMPCGRYSAEEKSLPSTHITGMPVTSSLYRPTLTTLLPVASVGADEDEDAEDGAGGENTVRRSLMESVNRLSTSSVVLGVGVAAPVAAGLVFALVAWVAASVDSAETTTMFYKWRACVCVCVCVCVDGEVPTRENALQRRSIRVHYVALV
jgi:hypothetical protein